MPALITLMVLCVGAAAGVMGIVARSALRDGRDVLTDDGEIAVARLKQKAVQAPGKAKSRVASALQRP